MSGMSYSQRTHDALVEEADVLRIRLRKVVAERQQAIDALRDLLGAVERENRKLLNPSKVWPMSINVRHAVRKGNALLDKLGEHA